MYKQLFNAITDPITTLQEVQREAENMYILSGSPDDNVQPQKIATSQHLAKLHTYLQTLEVLKWSLNK